MAERGGYHPDSRLETVKDEIVMELVQALRGPQHAQRTSFDEVKKLGLKYIQLLSSVNGTPSMHLGFVGT